MFLAFESCFCASNFGRLIATNSIMNPVITKEVGLLKREYLQLVLFSTIDM